MTALLANFEKLDFENECRVRRNRTDALCPIAKLRRNDERALAADPHTGETLLPPFYHTTFAEFELERLVAIVRAVKFRPVGKGSHVIDREQSASGRFRAGPHDIIADDKTVRSDRRFTLCRSLISERLRTAVHVSFCLHW